MPVANPDLGHTVPGSPVTIRLLDNDQGEGLVLVGLGAPAHGSVTVNPDQSVTYTPDAGFSGEDSFGYTIQDAGGGIAESTVSLLVDAAPIAVDDNAATTLATPVTVTVLANDVDPEGQPLGLVEVAAPGHGTVTVLPGQSLRYEPQHDFTGIDSFTYSISDIHGATAKAMVRVTVSESNGRPVAVPDTVTTTLDTPVTIQVLANDSDPDGDPLSLAGVTLPEHGTLLVNPDQSIVYAPAAGYAGEDEFAYTVSDRHGGTAVGSVSITVERPNSPPVAVDDAVTIAAGASTTIDLLANDSDPDGDPLTLVGVTMPQHGSLSTNPDQSVTYTPDAGFSGEDEFTYTISDGRGGTAVAEARITVEPPPLPPTFANGHAWRRRLVVPPRPLESAALTGFVLYVDMTADWLKTRALGGRIESAQGFDLRFELEDGSPLAHEIDLYDGAEGRLVAWVRIPSWAVTQQLRLFLYYGKPGVTESPADPMAVWAGYLAVWDVHSGDDRSLQGRDLVMTGVVPQPLLGGAGGFDGAGAHGRRTAAAGLTWLEGLTAMTVQAKVRSDVTGERRGILARGPAGGDDSACSLVLAYVEAPWAGASRAVQFQWRNANGSSYVVSSSNRQTTEGQLIHATWVSGQAPRLYLDGVEESSPARAEANAGTPTTPSGDLYLGVASTPLDPMVTGWHGLIDEVRIRPTALSPAHIATEHANQQEPTAFYGLGGEEDVSSLPAAVALPLTARTTAGKRVDIDAVAAAFVVAGGASVAGITVPAQPAHGLVTIVEGRLRYTPNAGYVGSDSFGYVLVDSAGRSSDSRVDVTIAALPSVALPSGFTWTLVGSHPTAWLTEQTIQENWNNNTADSGWPEPGYSYRRLSIVSAPDGLPALKHTVADGEIVWKVGFVSPNFDRDNGLDRAYLLRYRHWVVDYPGSGGKWMGFEGGRGWSADSYRYSSGSTYGTDGWGTIIMHPPRNSAQKLNGIGGFASNGTYASGRKYGTAYNSPGSWVVPQGRWFTVDALVVCPNPSTGQNGAYRMYVDGELISQLPNVIPAQLDMAKCRGLRMIVRLMDGGDPEKVDDQHVRPYSEYFSSFEIWRGS